MSSNPNNGANSSRRTFSSPYLASIQNRTKSQYKPRQGHPNNASHNNQNRSDRFSTPARGSHSAPSNLTAANPELHEFFQRRAELHKQVQKTLLKSKLDRLLNYQEQLEREINDLERGCGDAGIFASSSSAQTNRSKTVSASSSKTKLKSVRVKIGYRIQFRVLGGMPGNLSYKINRRPDKDGKIRSFSLEVDTKGFKPEFVEVESEDTIMTIRASKQNGAKKDLKVVAPSIKDMDKAYIHYPRTGVLVIDF